MANKLTSYLTKKLGTEVSNTDLLNSIREQASPAYQSDIDIITGAINHKNVPTDKLENHKNELFTALVNRIGAVIVETLDFQNPLSVFKTEFFEFGDYLQEIYIGLAERKDYNAKGDDHPFRYTDTEIKALYHELNNENLYERTINKAWTSKAFTSDRSFDEFIDGMLESLLSSDQIDEYQSVKDVLQNSLSEMEVFGQTVNIDGTLVDTNQDDYAVSFNKALIAKSKEFTIANRERFNNPAGVPSATPIDKQWLIINGDLSTDLDMIHANAFNMDKATVQARQIVVDNFEAFQGTGKYNGKTPLAFLVSEKTIILKDKLKLMDSIYDPKKLNHNYFLHHHYITSLSLFHNIHVFYKD